MRRLGVINVAVVLALVALLVAPWAALADNVVNDVAAHPGSDTFTVGGSTTVGYKIVATPDPGEPHGRPQCNPTSGPATVTIMAPLAVKASPASLTFTDCNLFQNVVFTATAPGDYTVSVTVSGSGSYNLTPGTFILHVLTPPDVTPPVITSSVTPAPNAAGWNNSDVTVSWAVADAESGIASSSGCTSTTLTAETAGTTLTCSASNGAGLSASASVTVNIDKTPPVISGSRTLGANANGWNNSDVAVSFICSDNLSGLASCPGPTTLSAEGAGQSVTGTATDKAGNSASATVADINIDKTPPTVSISASSIVLQGNSASATWAASDNLSGLVAGSGAIALDTSSPGLKTVAVTVQDKAGNSASTSATYTVWGVVGPFAPLVKNSQGIGQFKAGSTIPVKFQLTDGVSLVTIASGSVTIGSASAAFRWDATTQQYMANVKTASAMGTFPVRLTVPGIGSVDIASVTLR